MGEAPPTVPPAASEGARQPRPYATPTLRRFGTVTAITESLAHSGTTKDGGPNNTKT